MPAKPAAEPTHTFETAIGRLEAVVEEMGSDKLPLEDLIKRYEEGIQLVKVCEQKLQAVEKRVEILMRKADIYGPNGRIYGFEAPFRVINGELFHGENKLDPATLRDGHGHRITNY